MSKEQHDESHMQLARRELATPAIDNIQYTRIKSVALY